MRKLDTASHEANQYLTFLLDNEEYGLELLSIQEIRGYTPATPIPNVLPYVHGVINLRGKVLPIIDLHIRFGMSAVEYDKFTVIIITNVGSRVIGLLVDAISDVLEVRPETMRPAPDLGNAVDTHFIHGIFQCKDKLALALNLEKLLDVEAASPAQVN